MPQEQIAELNKRSSWGIGVMLGIYVAGCAGGHLNPAITFVNCMFRGFPWKKWPVYACAQVAGCFCGAVSRHLRTLIRFPTWLITIGCDLCKLQVCNRSIRRRRRHQNGARIFRFPYGWSLLYLPSTFPHDHGNVFLRVHHKCHAGLRDLCPEG